MTLPTLLLDLALILVGATVLVLAARAVGAPAIVAYIVAGLVLGPLLGLIAVDETLDLISEVGIALLLFLVGLELSFDKIRDVGRVAVVAGLGQVAFTAAGGFVLCLLLGFETIPAAFIAAALTFSSTVVVVKLLDQKGELDALYGRIAVGIFLVQDLVVVAALTLLAALGRPEEMRPLVVAGHILLAFGGMALLLGAALGASRWVLPTVFGWMARMPAGMFVWSLCWCFLFVLGAEALGLSLEVGAFLAGISLAQLPYNQELRRRVHPLMNFFIAVFFVTLGTQMEPEAAGAYWFETAVLSAFVLIGNPLIFIWIIRRLGYPERTSFLTGVTVAQISEFSFIFAALGLGTGLIDEAILAVIAMVGLVTIGASSYMILYNHQLYEWTRRRGLLRVFSPAGGEEDADVAATEAGRKRLRDHVIVVGMNELGRRVVEALCARGETVLAVDVDPEKLKDLPCRTLLGNAEYASLLNDLALEEARLLISALQIQETNNLLAYRCRVAGVPCAIHAFDQFTVAELRALGVDHLILSKNSGVQRIAAELRRAGLIAG